jgi:protein phosphatase
MKITIPELSLIALIGPSGAGKSTFAQKHFGRFEVLSSDYMRGLVANDENAQAATEHAFEVLHYVAGKRLKRGLLTVIDATNVQREARRPLIELARRYHVLPVAIAFNLPEKLCHERNRDRPDRDFGSHVIRRQIQEMRRSLRKLEGEGFRHVYILESPEQVDQVEIVREPLWNNRKFEHGPFDIIGDVHGCCDELVALLHELGYRVTISTNAEGRLESNVDAPAGRKAVFLGDLVDRGPNTPGVLRIAMSMVAAGTALCVPGNHDVKLMKKLKGRAVNVTHGLAESLEQLEREPHEFRRQVASFLESLVSHYLLDDGKLVVAHAGMKEALQGRGSARVRDFALYGETTGETDEFGLPVRFDWAAKYRGAAMVVYGHTPVPEPEWVNHTINIDTGCVFGARLTALRYPELQLVSVPAARVYSEPIRPLPQAATLLTRQQQLDDLLDLEDVTGKRLITTRLHGTVTIREENAAAALEAMSRFAADPRWLIYLPPTMSPTETSQNAGWLEHPAEAFKYYRHEGVGRVICQEKHMGSRAIIIVCQDADAARKRFGVLSDETGIVYTRTGRRFFADTTLETQLLDRLRSAIDRAGLWDGLQTSWLCFDAELLPWSAKAQELLRTQYAAVGAAAAAALNDAVNVLEAGALRLVDLAPLLERYRIKNELAARFVDAYRRYCWEVAAVHDLKIAPFHILASQDATHVGRDHIWHMETSAQLCQEDPEVLLATPYHLVETTDPAHEQQATEWWYELTERGGEGMVVKPVDFIARGRKGLAQPAVKCRGREYLRIIYGPEYTQPENLERLRARSVSHKRGLASREFALGVEALERFARKEPLRRVHECVFGVLALESEPVDPRL